MLNWLRKKSRQDFPFQNIYHCCAHKTGSQWILSVFNDPLIRKLSGLTVHTYTNYLPGGIDARKIDERFFDSAFPLHKIISPMYVSAAGYASIPKPERYASFFICRNPRDLVVSFYFSARFTHKSNAKIDILRDEMKNMEEEAGFIHAIKSMNEQGVFVSLKSWFVNPPVGENFQLFRFEELTDYSTGAVDRFLLNCRLPLSSADINMIKEKYSFAEQKKKNTAEGAGHYRSGGSDWKKYFTPAVEKYYTEVTGDLDKIMGYNQRD